MKGKYSILVVDDDHAHRTMLKTLFNGWGYHSDEADDGASAIEAVLTRPYDLILMDIRMIKVSGLEALEKIKRLNPSIPVIMMTAYASVDTAVKAMKEGAYDYVTKPLDFDELRIIIERAMEHCHLREENRILRESLSSQYNNFIGQSETMKKVFSVITQVAPSEATVLITGESGTGKEMIAGALHFNSHRKDGPFVKINCAAITETLLESELFGHERGAFTGAERRREGKFRQANGGTLFLDEVSEMSPAMQVKLLRVLQEKEFCRVGGEEVIRVDVRIIAATNKDLRKEVETGRFREDLYYRLNVVEIHVPPLRDRREDIPLLAQYYLKHFSEKNHKNIKGFTPQAMDHLVKYHWPGNIRELMNAVERAVILARSNYLTDELFLFSFRYDSQEEHSVLSPLKTSSFSLVDMERETVLRALEQAGGNKSEAARRLGITRRTLHLKLKKYGLM